MGGPTEPAAQPQVTQLLANIREGDQNAVEELTPLVYDELRRLAGRQMSGERGSHTLQATALVNEAYLKLIDQHERGWESKSHFLSIASTAI